MGTYQTKVMRPVNLKGLSAAKESLEQAICQAEQNGDTGEVTITALMRSGGIISVRQATNKTLPMPDPNT